MTEELCHELGIRPAGRRELDSSAASEEASLTGAWWVGLQTSEHLLAAVAKRDPRTGRPLPQMAADVMEAVRGELQAGPRPYPFDLIHRAMELSEGAIEEILEEPNEKILRVHEMRPVHQVRRMDDTCMRWLTKQPGRTVRDKLASRREAMAVVQRYSPDTLENRVVSRVVQTFRGLLEDRLQDPETFDDGGRVTRESLEGALELCGPRFRRSDLAEVPPSVQPRPNHVLVDDRNYSRVWRAYQLLERRDEALRESWPRLEQRIARAVFWSFAAQLADQPGVDLWERPLRLRDPEDGGLAVTGVDADGAEMRWRQSPFVVFRLHAAETDGVRGEIKRIIKGQFGFARADDGREVYFDEDCLSDGLRVDELSKGQRVRFDLGKPPGPGKSPPTRDLRLARPQPATLLRVCLHPESQAISVKVCHVAADQSVGFDDASSMTYRVMLRPSAELREGRGARFAIVHRERTLCEGRADFLGYRRATDELVAELDWLCGRGWSSDEESHAEAVSAPMAPSDGVLGLDTGLSRPIWSEGNGERRAGVRAWTERRSLPEGDALWLRDEMERPRLPGSTDSSAVARFRLEDLLDPDGASGAPGRLKRAGREIVGALAGDVRNPSDLEVGYAVPDLAGAFGRATLQRAMDDDFQEAVPVWRSVAAATGWRLEESGRVDEGRLVLVVDVETGVLTVTPLVARHDDELEREFPESDGMYWERRAPFPSVDADELLTYRQIQLDYVLELLNRFDIEGDEVVGRRFVKTGRVEELIERGEILESVDTAGEEWIRLTHDRDLWRERLSRWKELFEKRLTEVFAGERLRSLLQQFEPSVPAKILLVGRPSCFESDEVLDIAALDAALAGTASNREWAAVTDVVGDSGFAFAENDSGERFFVHKSRFDSDGAFDALETGTVLSFVRGQPNSEGQNAPAHAVTAGTHHVIPEGRSMAAGAQELARRHLAGVVAWKDWLEPMALEAIADGHVGTVTLVEGTEEGVSTGEQIDHQPAEVLRLPPGERPCVLPLVSGRRERAPIGREGYVPPGDWRRSDKSGEFNAEFSYTHGIERSWELALRGTSAETERGQRLGVDWRAVGEGAGHPDPGFRIPSFESGSWKGHEKYGWFRSEGQRFVQRCKRAFEGSTCDRSALGMLLETEDSGWPWFRRALVPPVEELWKEGRSLQNAPAEVGSLGEEVIGYLKTTAGFGQALPNDIKAELDSASASHHALKVLARFGPDCPEPVGDELVDQMRQHGDLDERRERIWQLKYVLADGRGHRRAWLETAFDLLEEFRSTDGFEPALGNAVLGALGAAAWRHPDLVDAFLEVDRGAVDLLVDVAGRSLRNVLARLPELIEEVERTDRSTKVGDLRKYESPYENACRLLLALLRLRAKSDVQRLEAGRAELVRLARTIRRIDALLVDAGRSPVAWSLPSKVEVPGYLHRMSKLGYAASTYLMGHEEPLLRVSS